MLIIKKNLLSIAVIDPLKKVGEPGQYVKYSGKETDFAKIILIARFAKKEIRYYYNDLITNGGEAIPAKVIITEVPPGHIQPFHTHDKVYELTVINEGKLTVIDSQALQENDIEEIMRQGESIEKGDMIIEDPGIRHTVMNQTDTYVVMTTIQVARIPFEQFSADWKR